MKEYERESQEKNNPFCYVQPRDRRTILRLLFPTIDHDLLFYPDNDNEQLLDDFNIPKKTYGVMPYIITHDSELREFLYEKCYEFAEKRRQEYRDKGDQEYTRSKS